MLAARLAVEDLVEELIAAQADVGARDKWGMDLGRLMCYIEAEQMGCEIKCKRREKQWSDWKLGDSPPSLSPCSQGGKFEVQWQYEARVFPHHPQQHTALAYWKLEWPCLRKERGLPVPQTQNNAPLSLPRTGDITRGNASCPSAVTRATLPPLRDPAGPRSPSPKPRSRGKREPRRLALCFGVTTAHVILQGKPRCTGPPP